MRTNRLREQLKESRPLFGVMADIASPRLVEFYGLLGFDWVMIDAEHDGISVESCYNLVTSADATGMASLVRVPENRPEVILPYADTGASAIIAPHVRTPEDAARLVSALRFPPHGTRGVAGSSRAANYGATQSPKDFFHATQNHPVVCALMEDEEAYHHAEGIIGEDGIDIICLGTGDLAASLGHPGEKQIPQVGECVVKAAGIAKRLGKHLNAAAGTPADLEQAARLGARMVMVSNTALVASATRDFLRSAREAFSAPATGA
ncbi:HpcH/HpaI aldolase family protein [Nitratireductor sp.]|uniref:HpcH/HpaI aldolase family protein n=1 Tax=Nitratireductor sp. TaxID=1872084 RepID=UPI0025E37BE2|nr:aldolase/citrate lyase family protein [Nitratireductor sp.]